MGVENFFPTGGKKQATAAAKSGGDGVLDVEGLDRRKRLVRRFLRVGGGVGLVVLLVLLVRVLNREPVVEVVQSADVPIEAVVDVSTASSVAQSVARSFLVFDDDREARLSTNWDGAGNGGWDGRGSGVTSGWTYTAHTEVISSTEVDVTVAVFSAPDGGASAWVGVLVPMQINGDRASVRATPKIVGLPDPSVGRELSVSDVDRDLTDISADSVAQFFVSWSGGDASAVVAPGAVVVPPPEGWGEALLKSWKVESGSGDRRTGVAEVVWAISDISLTNFYEVEIQRVAAGTDSRWQVSAIK